MYEVPVLAKPACTTAVAPLQLAAGPSTPNVFWQSCGTSQPACDLLTRLSACLRSPVAPSCLCGSSSAAESSPGRSLRCQCGVIALTPARQLTKTASPLLVQPSRIQAREIAFLSVCLRLCTLQNSCRKPREAEASIKIDLSNLRHHEAPLFPKTPHHGISPPPAHSHRRKRGAAR